MMKLIEKDEESAKDRGKGWKWEIGIKGVG